LLVASSKKPRERVTAPGPWPINPVKEEAMSRKSVARAGQLAPIDVTIGAKAAGEVA
jgi:hypothetical protein